MPSSKKNKKQKTKKTAALWNRIRVGYFPEYYNLNISKSGLKIIFHTYPSKLHPLLLPLKQELPSVIL